MQIQFRALRRFLFGALLCVVPSVADALAQANADDELHVTAPAEFHSIHKYPTRKPHKAIAVGPSGHWTTFYNVASAELAAKSALDACNQLLLTSKSKSLNSKKCALFEIDGKRTGEASPIGIPFGTIAEGEDLPWKRGKEWDASTPNKRGTMLMLHGCQGMDADSAWEMSWINYYRAAGFRVIKPDSFAEKRDPHSCPPLSEHDVNRQTRNLKLRVAQTLRTIAGIRKKYPGEPLYLHGHSEGGAVAQALGEKADGIIVTGAICGFGSSRAYWVSEGVPVLVIVGTKDPTFPEAASAKKLSSYCRDVSGAGQMTVISVTGMDHYAAIWWPEVQDAIGKFLRIPPIKIGRRPSDGIAFPKVSVEKLKRYEKAPRHKAIAADKYGNSSATAGVASKLDAEESALFHCDQQSGKDLFADPAHNHECVLVDVNGKRLVK